MALIPPPPVARLCCDPPLSPPSSPEAVSYADGVDAADGKEPPVRAGPSAVSVLLLASGGEIFTLPDNVLSSILLTYTTTENLLRHVAVCARVHPEFRRLVYSSAAYAVRVATTARPTSLPTGGLEGSRERERVLRSISRALWWSRNGVKAGTSGELTLSNAALGHHGGRALGESLQATSAPLTSINLACCSLSEGAARTIALGIQRSCCGVKGGLRSLDVCSNPAIGDAGLAVLVEACRNHSLEQLMCYGVGAGDRSMAALAAILPTTSITKLNCGRNPAVSGSVGWSVLAAALPRLHSLQNLNLYGSCDGMGCTGAIALATNLPRVRKLEFLNLGSCSIRDAGAEALAAVVPYCAMLSQLAFGGNEVGAAATRALKEAAAAVPVPIADEEAEVEEAQLAAGRAHIDGLFQLHVDGGGVAAPSRRRRHVCVTGI